MELEILTDKEKLNEWITLCLKFKLLNRSDISYLEKSIEFTGYGSVIPLSMYGITPTSIKSAIELVDNSKANELAMYVLQALCGILRFKDIETEFVFWIKTKKRFIESFSIDFTDSIMPYYVIKDTFGVYERVKEYLI